MTDLTPAAQALLKRLRVVLTDLTPEFLALIEHALLKVQAEARATAEAEIAALRTLLDEGITATYDNAIARTAWRHRADRLLAAPPAEPVE